jgi:asparagine synthase (glutamine-hydrolysing)
MVPSYLILVDRDVERLARKIEIAGRENRLALCFKSGDLAVLANGACACLPLPAGHGLLVGTIFPRYGPARQLDRGDRRDIEAIGANPLETLAGRYWGSYIACLTDGDTVTIARDPSGGLPCYFAFARSTLTVASDAFLLVRSGALRGSIAWEEIPRYLASKDLPFERTAIEGMRELLSGTVFIFGSRGGELSAYWNPWDHTGEEVNWDTDEVLDKLRRAVDTSIAAWASRYERPLVTVSGGLDSSVVLSSLSRIGANPACITISSNDPHGDERPFARAITGSVGAPLHEDRYQLGDVDLGCSVTAHLPKPCGRIHELAYNAALVRHVHCLGADVVMTGNGGDNIFYNSGSVRPLLDRVLRHGLTLAAFGTIGDICAVTRATPWQVIREAVRLAPQMRRSYRWLREVDFLSAETHLAVDRAHYHHPWLLESTGALPGKSGHVAMILRMQNHIEGYLRAFGIPMINPLTSQPIMEACLAIPSWRMIEGGVDRALVRRAFASRLPETVLHRRSKGGPAGFAISVIEEKGREVRARLLDGELVRRGLLDAAALERALAQGPAIGLAYMRILSFLDIEAWLSNWQEISPNLSGAAPPEPAPTA